MYCIYFPKCHNSSYVISNSLKDKKLNELFTVVTDKYYLKLISISEEIGTFSIDKEKNWLDDKIMKIDWKKIAPYLVALVVFVGFAIAYCNPQFNGRVLQQGDINTWKGAANEAIMYYDANGEPTGWTNSMFGGMPTYQITFRNAAGMTTSFIKNQLVHLWGEPITAILLYFIGFYLMLLCFGINAWLALAGALAMGLSSYFFIIT